ncbi:hypothetical protein D5086_003196 [Populus alba]|uniref:Uncharacterized protein n=2 Tax=Populus alba TaxID=43335 RepID=A0ACC4D3U2_POPAL
MTKLIAIAKALKIPVSKGDVNGLADKYDYQIKTHNFNRNWIIEDKQIYQPTLDNGAASDCLLLGPSLITPLYLHGIKDAQKVENQRLNSKPTPRSTEAACDWKLAPVIWPRLLVGQIIFYNCTDIATAAYGDYWRQLRKVSVLELLSPKRVQSFRSIREEEVSSLIGSISSSAGSIINLSRMLFSVAYNITTRAAFSKLRKEEEIFVPLVQGIIQVGAGFNISDLFPSIKLLPWISGMRSRMERLHQEADRILESIIKEHRARKAEGNSSNEKKADDLVDVLLHLQEHGNLDFSLTTDNIKAVILNFKLKKKSSENGHTHSCFFPEAIEEQIQ